MILCVVGQTHPSLQLPAFSRMPRIGVLIGNSPWCGIDRTLSKPFDNVRSMREAQDTLKYYPSPLLPQGERGHYGIGITKPPPQTRQPLYPQSHNAHPAQMNRR